MAYKQFPTDKYLKEVQQKLHLIEVEKPIIDKYYTEVRAKVKPIIEQLPENPSESQIRNYVINELSPILKNQTVNFVENLMKANDLMAFYKFGKTFLNEVKDIRNLDSSFLADLWSKYKSKMLIYAESNLPKTGLTPTEYENALKHNRRVASSKDLEYPEIVIAPNNPKSLSYPDTNLKEIVINSKYNTPLSGIQKDIPNAAKKARNARFKKSLYPLFLEEPLKHYAPSTVKGKPFDFEDLPYSHLTGHPKKKGIGATGYDTSKYKKGYSNYVQTGFPVGRPPKLSESNIKVFDKRTGTYKKSSNPASTTAASSYQGEGLRMHPKFIGRGIPGITTYARR